MNLRIIFKYFFGIVCFFSVKSLHAQFNLEWAHTYGSNSYEVVGFIQEDNFGNVYSTGYFADSSDFDPGPDTWFLTSNGLDDMFIQKNDSAGNLLWAVSIGGGYYESGWALTVDQYGNVYCTGSFNGTVDFDPGSDTFELASVGEDDAFILKLNSDGDLIWAVRMGNYYGWCAGMNIITDSLGNVYTSGRFQLQTDFNPGPGTYYLDGFDGDDIFIQKLDSAGHFIWAKEIGGYGYQAAHSMKINKGYLYTTGDFYYTTDFDPSWETYEKTSMGDEDFYVQKMDLDGNFIWVSAFGGLDKDLAIDINFDSYGNIYVTGAFVGTCDFDPGAGNHNITGVGSNDSYLLNLDTNGNLVWVITSEGAGAEAGRNIEVDDDGNIYLGGVFTDTFDVDPGLGITNLVSKGSIDVYILKLDPGANFIMASSFGGTSTEDPYHFTLDKSGNIYSSGQFFGTCDFAPGDSIMDITSAGLSDAYIVKLSQSGCPSFGLAIDSVADLSCSVLGYATAHAFNGTPTYTYEWNTLPVTTSAEVNFEAAGIFTLTATDQEGCLKSTSVLVNGPSVLGNFNLNVNLLATAFRPGVSSDIWIDASNTGCLPVSGSLILILDSLLVYNGCDIPPVISGDSLIWNFTDFNYDSLPIALHINVTTVTNAGDNDVINLTSLMIPEADDFDTTNNIRNYEFNVVYSYDPNDKHVYPPGKCNAGYIMNDQVLTYSVRFQNTGTADAIDVYVMDSLSEYLDVNTVKVVSTSHAMFTEVLPDNILKFHFNNIHLPDSTTNEPESHGYVVYQVLPLSGLANETQIENSASIYFDYNDPVITNSTLNTIIDVIPEYEIVQALSICSGETISVGENQYSEPGTYVDHLSSISGCDSTVTTILTLHPLFSDSIGAEICDGETYEVGGYLYNAPGTYTIALTSIYGCDSIVTLQLDVSPVYNESIDASLCAGDVLEFGGMELTSPGIYTKVFTSLAGCDSTVELTLSMEDVETSVTVSEPILTADLPGAAYQWIDCSNSNAIIDGATNQSYIPQETGNYAVIVSDGGCSDTSDCYFIDVTGTVENWDLSSVSLFPNPASDQLILLLDNIHEEMVLEISNITGQLVFHMGNIKETTVMVDVAQYETGWYFIKLFGKKATTRLPFFKQ